MHVQSCCFASSTYCFFDVLVAVAVVVVKAARCRSTKETLESFFSKILREFLPFCNFAELTSFLSRFLLAVAILLFQNCTPIPKSSVVINSIVEDGIKIGENSVISNCHLKVYYLFIVVVTLFFSYLTNRRQFSMVRTSFENFDAFTSTSYNPPPPGEKSPYL